MEKVELERIEIKDTESAKRIYGKIQNYLLNKTNEDITIVDISRDDRHYTWEEYIFHCINSTVRAHLSHPDHNHYGKPDIHELIIEIVGEKIAKDTTKRRLEEVVEEKFN